MFCIHCGSKIDSEKGKFCRNCGGELFRGDTTPAANQGAAPQTPANAEPSPQPEESSQPQPQEQAGQPQPDMAEPPLQPKESSQPQPQEQAGQPQPNMAEPPRRPRRIHVNPQPEDPPRRPRRIEIPQAPEPQPRRRIEVPQAEPQQPAASPQPAAPAQPSAAAPPSGPSPKPKRKFVKPLAAGAAIIAFLGIMWTTLNSGGAAAVGTFRAHTGTQFRRHAIAHDKYIYFVYQDVRRITAGKGDMETLVKSESSGRNHNPVIIEDTLYYLKPVDPSDINTLCLYTMELPSGKETAHTNIPGMSFRSDGAQLYIMHPQSRAILRIDPKTLSTIDEISLPQINPSFLVAGGFLYYRPSYNEPFSAMNLETKASYEVGRADELCADSEAIYYISDNNTTVTRMMHGEQAAETVFSTSRIAADLGISQLHLDGEYLYFECYPHDEVDYEIYRVSLDGKKLQAINPPLFSGSGDFTANNGWLARETGAFLIEGDTITEAASFGQGGSWKKTDIPLIDLD